MGVGIGVLGTDVGGSVVCCDGVDAGADVGAMEGGTGVADGGGLTVGPEPGPELCVAVACCSLGVGGAVAPHAAARIKSRAAAVQMIGVTMNLSRKVHSFLLAG